MIQQQTGVARLNTESTLMSYIYTYVSHSVWWKLQVGEIGVNSALEEK